MRNDTIMTPWIKSSYSNTGANCVEFSRTALGDVAMRDSKNPGGPAFRFTPDEWRAFISAIRAGKL
jgi:hypothetical protein